jgi:BirA family transcriptional regulator, biotin operon repressor / biotin---[acetyl-CoA-carboxylase] ligase
MSKAGAHKPLTFALLRRLADGEFHSGEVLARQFGVTRATVNNALQDVENFGLDLYSVRGRGYRLAHPLQWLDADLICAGLEGMRDDLHIEIVDHAASSNALLLQRAAQGAASGTVLAVEWQNAGRGRLGKTWHSGLGDALTFSLLWRFDSGLAALSGLSLVVGIAMMRALDELGVPGTGLKWPNDVLLNGGKLAGILLEAQGDMLGPSAVVIGIGLNLSVPEALRERIDQPVSDLASLDMPLPERNHILAVSLKHLAAVLREFAGHGFSPLREEWEKRHVFQQRPVRMLLPDGLQVTGMALGVTDDGALRLATAQGEQIFNAGEVSLRSA